MYELPYNAAQICLETLDAADIFNHMKAFSNQLGQCGGIHMLQPQMLEVVNNNLLQVELLKDGGMLKIQIPAEFERVFQVEHCEHRAQLAIRERCLKTDEVRSGYSNFLEKVKKKLHMDQSAKRLELLGAELRALRELVPTETEHTKGLLECCRVREELVVRGHQMHITNRTPVPYQVQHHSNPSSRPSN
jgi:hypothetical protein